MNPKNYRWRNSTSLTLNGDGFSYGCDLIFWLLGEVRSGNDLRLDGVGLREKISKFCDEKIKQT